jgi:ubiquinone/menaquinone biosynthesis C-methylase UbiE
MDAPGLPDAEVAAAYRVLARVNRQLGNVRTMKRELRRCLTEDCAPAATVSLLDLGSGAGDIPRALQIVFQRRGVVGVTVVLDHDPTAVSLAGREGLAVLKGDALRIPLADRSIDVVTTIKVAHHFSGEALTGLIAEMARVARRRVIVLDIRRHWLAYAGFIAWSQVCTGNRVVRHDGALSVLRGFTAAELIAATALISGLDWAVRPYLGFQLALVGRRRGAGSPNVRPAHGPDDPGDSASPLAVDSP